MTDKQKRETAPANRRTITLERTFAAPLEDVWALWTTKDGVESWWGPDGYVVKVRRLDLRPGGEMEYAMIAVGEPQIAYMKQNGMPLSVECRLTYTEVAPRRRLAYRHLADFIPDVEPYDVMTVVELFQRDDGVRMVMRFDAMHDERWTHMAVSGWENELDKLARALAKGLGKPTVEQSNEGENQ